MSTSWGHAEKASIQNQEQTNHAFRVVSKSLGVAEKNTFRHLLDVLYHLFQKKPKKSSSSVSSVWLVSSAVKVKLVSLFSSINHLHSRTMPNTQYCKSRLRLFTWSSGNSCVSSECVQIFMCKNSHTEIHGQCQTVYVLIKNATKSLGLMNYEAKQLSLP